MARADTYDYSDFLDDWEKLVNPPPLSDQLEDLVLHAQGVRIMTPKAREQQLADFRSLLSYRHVFS
jgi:hypothetical protein